MSACTNCPCHTYDSLDDEYCGLDLDIFDAWNKPDYCLDGEALKAREENHDLILVTVDMMKSPAQCRLGNDAKWCQARSRTNFTNGLKQLGSPDEV